MDKVLLRVIEDVAKKHDIDVVTAELVYNSMFKFIKGTIENVDFSKITEEDDLRKIKTNFNIPRIFKLYTTPERIQYARDRIKEKDSKDGKGALPGNETE